MTPDIKEKMRIVRDLDIEAARPMFEDVAKKHSFKPPIRDDGTETTVDEVILAALHKARVTQHWLYAKEKTEESVKWLKANNYKVPNAKA